MTLHEKLMKKDTFDADNVIGVIGSRFLRRGLKIGDGLGAKLQNGFKNQELIWSDKILQKRATNTQQGLTLWPVWSKTAVAVAGTKVWLDFTQISSPDATVSVTKFSFPISSPAQDVILWVCYTCNLSTFYGFFLMI